MLLLFLVIERGLSWCVGFVDENVVDREKMSYFIQCIKVICSGHGSRFEDEIGLAQREKSRTTEYYSRISGAKGEVGGDSKMQAATQRVSPVADSPSLNLLQTPRHCEVVHADNPGFSSNKKNYLS